jgi:putative FmdB family regulatory protein
MPLYEYECESCGSRLEHIHQKFSDPRLEECPKCGGKLRKLISSPAFQFKGSGWYVTDYARKGEGKEPKSDKDSKDAKDTRDSSTGTSEPATKDASKESSKESSKASSKESTKTDKPAAPDK